MTAQPHPNPKVRCGSCPGWVATANGIGECHGGIPQAAVIPVQQPPVPVELVAVMRPQGPQIAVQSVFPPMKANGWCAKHPEFRWDDAFGDFAEASGTVSASRA